MPEPLVYIFNGGNHLTTGNSLNLYFGVTHLKGVASCTTTDRGGEATEEPADLVSKGDRLRPALWIFALEVRNVEYIRKTIYSQVNVDPYRLQI